MKPLIVYGTRPEYIKLKPIIDAFNKLNYPIDILQVGQHTKEFIGTNVESNVNIIQQTGNRLNDIQVGSFHTKLDVSENNLMIVHGDTATAMAMSMNAFNSGIKVAHIEAGLRTFDKENPYPEEMYRSLIDRISTLHFCPRIYDYNNLIFEGIEPGIINNIKFYGNTVIDELPNIPIKRNNKVLVTLHRRENRSLFNMWIDEIDAVASRHKLLDFVFIMHPSNPSISPSNLRVIEPLPREELLKFIAQEANFIITDSGGIQEECSHYNKPVIVCRKITERPYNGSEVCPYPQLLNSLVIQYMDKEIFTRGTFGFGDSGKKIVDSIITYLNG